MVTQRRMKQLARVMTRLCLETSPMCPPPHHSPSPFPAARCLTGALIILSSCTCTSVAELRKQNCTLCSNMLLTLCKDKKLRIWRGDVVEKYFTLLHNGGTCVFLYYSSDTEDEKAYKNWKKSIMLVWRSAANHKSV